MKWFISARANTIKLNLGFLLIRLPIREMFSDFIIRTSSHGVPLPPCLVPIPYSRTRTPHPVMATQYLRISVAFPLCVICPSHILHFLHASNASYFVLSRMRTPFPMRHFTFRIAGHRPLRRQHLSSFLSRGHTISTFSFSSPLSHFVSSSQSSRLAKANDKSVRGSFVD